jgi:transcription elongation factor SPT6
VAPTIPFGPDDIDDAAMWVTPRLSARKTTEYFSPNGPHQALRTQLVAAVSYVLNQLFVENVEVPYIWHHRRDYISHFDASRVRTRIELLNLSELWRIYTLGQKYRSLLERRRALTQAYTRLNVTDSYYEEEIVPRIESVDVVADTSEWLTMKYKDKKQEESQFRFHDDEEPQETIVKRKMPSRISAYEVAKKSVISKLAQVRTSIEKLIRPLNDIRVSVLKPTKLYSISCQTNACTLFRIRSSIQWSTLNSSQVLILSRPYLQRTSSVERA